MILRFVERALIGVGISLCVAWAGARLHGEIGRRAGLRAFAQASSPDASAALPSTDVDDRLWSKKRVQAYRETLRRKFPAPLAVLRIPRARVEVPVFSGTDDVTLNRGVGWIESTKRPGETGNVGIAGHRDGFFRGLKDIAKGDLITLETAKGTDEYVIDDIRIVSPEDVSVLDPTPSPTVTLVTCYPFYFVGDAPQRYIVRAVRRGPATQKASTPR